MNKDDHINSNISKHEFLFFTVNTNFKKNGYLFIFLREKKGKK